MNDAELIARLRAFPYDPKEYWVVAGGAMVLHGIRPETADVDLGCTSAMADRLAADGYPYSVTPDGNRRFRVDGGIEVFENWLYDSIVLIEGIQVISVQGLLTMKRLLGREKDVRDVALIREYRRAKGSGQI